MTALLVSSLAVWLGIAALALAVAKDSGGDMPRLLALGNAAAAGVGFYGALCALAGQSGPSCSTAIAALFVIVVGAFEVACEHSPLFDGDEEPA